MSKKLIIESGATFIDIQSYTDLETEGYKMSAELEWYRRFHDYIKASALIDSVDYIEVCNFINSEDDR